MNYLRLFDQLSFTSLVSKKFTAYSTAMWSCSVCQTIQACPRLSSSSFLGIDLSQPRDVRCRNEQTLPDMNRKHSKIHPYCMVSNFYLSNQY